MNEKNFNRDFSQNYNSDDDYDRKPYRSNNDRRPKPEHQDSVFNVRVKAGSKRTYFFDVKTNRKEDYFIIITERRKRFDDANMFDKNKIFLYKEDFNKFVKGLNEAVNYVKTELMPDFDFSVFDREHKDLNEEENEQGQSQDFNQQSQPTQNTTFTTYNDNDTL